MIKLTSYFHVLNNIKLREESVSCIKQWTIKQSHKSEVKKFTAKIHKMRFRSVMYRI